MRSPPTVTLPAAPFLTPAKHTMWLATQALVAKHSAAVRAEVYSGAQPSCSKTHAITPNQDTANSSFPDACITWHFATSVVALGGQARCGHARQRCAKQHCTETPCCRHHQDTASSSFPDAGTSCHELSARNVWVAKR